MFWKSRMDWNVRAMPRPTIALGRRPTMLWPSKRISPWSGASSPVTTLKKVVFPAPFGPIRPTIERGGMTRSTLLTATSPPKALVTPRASSRGRPPARGAAAGRSHTGMLSARGTDGAATRRPASSGSSTSTATGRTRRPTSPSGLKSMTRARPSPKKNQRQSVRSTVVSNSDAGLGPDPPDEVRHLGQQEAVEQRDQHPAHDDALEAPHPAEHDHAQQDDGHVELESAGSDGLELRGVEGAGEPREGRPEREGEELGLDGVDPHAVRRRLVLPDGHPRAPEPRVAQPVHRPQRPEPR